MSSEGDMFDVIFLHGNVSKTAETKTNYTVYTDV